LNKKIVILLFFVIYPLILFSQSNFDIELVESIPAETTLDNPDIRNTQEVWLEMINSAKRTLDIEQFYISNEKGEPLDTILNTIVAAANRGVEVRIIVDAGMYNTYPADVSWLDAQSYNIEVRRFDVKSLTGGIQHAKFFIVDGEQVFLGSQNFDWRSLKHIHELGVRIKHNDCITIYQEIFEYDWCYSGSNVNCFFKQPYGNRCTIFNNLKYGLMDIYAVYSSISIFNDNILYARKHNNYFKKSDLFEYTDCINIINMIDSSKSEITLQFLSYNVKYKDEYWSEVDSALIRASERGVKVKLIVSDWNLGNTAVEHFKELISHPNIEIKYTEIPEYSGGYIPFARVEHCKFITADSVCWIGTSNMSQDYFYNSRNVGVVIENGKFTQRVRDIFYKSWNSEYAHKTEPDGIYEVRKHGE
jgi:phosphatidylserine/phosphatidylglycerophosphate/cardiolipin synthase-like enzyme